MLVLVLMLIAFDWDGVFARNEIANEAAQRRLKQLGVDVSKEYIRQAQRSLSHYELTKQAISQYTGITDPRTLTVIMVNLFVPHYIALFHERKEKSVYGDFVQVVQEAKKTYSLQYVLITGLAQRTIDPVLDLLKIRPLFDLVVANTEDLLLKKEEQLRKAKDHFKEDVALMVGDRKDDLVAGRAVDAKTAFVVWGVGKLEECEEIADYVLDTAADFSVVVDSLL